MFCQYKYYTVHLLVMHKLKLINNYLPVEHHRHNNIQENL